MNEERRAYDGYLAYLAAYNTIAPMAVKWSMGAFTFM